MKINFLVNDYLLAWNLLFGASISEESHVFKQKLWITYKKKYNDLSRDNKEILQDLKNFIPNNDTLYNIVFKSEIFEQVKRETEKHRVFLLKAWDSNKKNINTHLKEILKFDITNNYNILVVHPKMDYVYYNIKNEERNIVWGRSKDKKSDLAALISIIYAAVRYQVGNYQKEYREIVQAILELAITNELCTRLSGVSSYLSGDGSLKFLKKQIYPYWLMYLGATKEEYTKYMMRDGIVFDGDRYTSEPKLKELNLFQFIDFCIKNQKYIIRINQLEII